MPLQSTSQDYKEYLMKNRGIDSTQFNLDDEGNVVPRTIEQPVLNDSEKSIIDPSNLPNAKPQTSVGGTLVHGALNSALPTVAGLGVAGLTSLALAPETGGLSLLGLLGTGIAGAVGGGATSAVQDKLMPDSFKQQLAQEATDNPVSAFVGRNIPQALAFNPLTGAKNLLQAISTGGKSVAPDFAKSVISNMGISGGIDAAQQLASGQPFNYGQLGESVGTAALFNQPNALGRKLMFEPKHIANQPVQGEPAISKTHEQIMAEEAMQPNGENSSLPLEENVNESRVGSLGNVLDAFNKTKQTSTADPFDTADRSETKTIVNPENKELGGLAGLGDLAEAFNPTKQTSLDLNTPSEEHSHHLNDTGIENSADIRNKKGRIIGVGKGKIGEYADQPFHSNVFDQTGIGNDYDVSKAFNNEADKVQAESQKRADDFEFAKQELERESAIQDQKNKIELDRQKNAQDASDNAARALELKKALEDNQTQRSSGLGVGLENHEVGVPKPGYEVQPDYTGNVEHDNSTAANESDLAERQLEARLGGNKSNSIKYQDESAQQPVAKTKEESAYLYRNAKPEYKKAVQQLMVKRGISLHEAVNLVNPATDKEVLGSSNAAKREVTLNPNKAEVDTPIHEVSHQFLDDLSKSSDPADQKLARDAQAIFKGHVKGAEEGTAIDQGLMGANRLATSLEGTPIERARGWAKDFMSRWKYNLNLHSDEDVSRHLSQRIQTDAPSFGFENKIVPLVSEDKQKYDDLTKQFKAEKDEQKRIAIQQQMEDIKNRNGGMPPTKYQDESAIPQENPNKDKSLGITRSALDDIMKKDGPEARPIVDAFSRYYSKRDEIRARYSKPVYDAAKGMPEDSQNRIEQALLDARTSNGSQIDTLTSDKEKNLYKVMRDTLDLIPKDRNEANMPVRAFNDKGESYLRQAKSDPNYMYNQMSPKVIEALSANRNSEESKGYKKAFLDHQAAYGTKPEQAKAMWDNMTKAYDKGASSQDHFRGLDIEQGAGLPSELMRPGLLRNFDRYINRVSSARAFHDTIESNNEVASKLGYKTTPWDKPLPPSDFHSPRVNEVLKHIKGEQFDPEEAKVKGWNRVATSLMLGPLTNIHIAASSLANSLAYFRPSEVAGAVTHMITDFHTGVQHALENGSLTQKRQIFSDLVNAHSTSLEKLNGLADGISRLNGRSATEYITKGILQSAGEHLVRTRIPLAQAGDEGAIRLMKHIDPDFSPTKKYDEKEVQRLASNFSGLLHGKHDARTMPAWMLHETALQPFFSLASWSIGQTNTFMKHVVTPAINDHNYTPLLMSTLGAGLGGYVIKELREGLSNKKSPIPSFNEIANSPRGVSGNLPLVGYNLAAMASFAGYAGILSTGVKTLFDGAYKNAPQGATFPLDEVAGNVVHIANNAYAAMMNTSDPKEYVKIGTKAIADILRENIQTARIASSWGDEAGLLGSDRQYKKKLNVEEDQLRRYKTTAGLPITDESSAGSDNPYYQENRKAFKHTLDLKEAAKQVPELIKQAMDEATIDGHLNPEILREKLKALKGSSYSSMPNPDNAPLQFYNYLNYLKKSKGDSYAQQHLIEYMKNNAIGKARSSLIPSI